MYQNGEDFPTTKPTAKPTTNGQQMDTNKNVKNVNNNIYSQIQNEFNSICINLSAIKKITIPRKKVIDARIKEYGLETVLEVFKIVNKSNFLNGDSERGWKASFDWIMKPSNFTKILEGNYNNRDTKQDQEKNKSKYDEDGFQYF